ncbi:MAG: SDR family oxidoreductase [Methylotenera sp.]|nr:SDR family oxidoreductase [Oligoflexia bacterium]
MTNPTHPIVLVTGAQGSLGKFVIRKLLHQGYQVIATHHLTKPTPAAPLEKSPTATLTWVQMDVTSPQSVKAAIQGLPPQLSKIDHLIHCAGGFRYAMGDSVRDDDIEFLLDVNLKSSFYLIRELLPKMKKNAFGRIVLVSSKATLNPGAGMGIYGASKAALNALVSSVADEVRSFDININAVLPSVIDTPVNRKEMPKADYTTWVTPDALADIMVSLIEPWGKPIHGALIPVAGRV